VLALGALMAGAVVALPAVAASEGAQPVIEAENRGGVGGYGEEHAWRNGTQTIQAGGAVTISNPTEVAHGVQWVSGPGAPACSGVANAGATKWSGSCTFSQAGTYVFYCTVHGAAMKGTITVNATPGAPPPSPPPPPSAMTPVSTSPATPSAGSSPLAGPASSALQLAGVQHSSAVRGKLALSQAAAGGRLEVRLQASSAALARHSHQVQVGRLLRTQLAAGTASFRVPLDARAKRALKARRRLALSVTLVVTPPTGAAVTLHRAVTLRA
jgi:plastocyanin